MKSFVRRNKTAAMAGSRYVSGFLRMVKAEKEMQKKCEKTLTTRQATPAERKKFKIRTNGI